jgi:hypothetical protein
MNRSRVHYSNWVLVALLAIAGCNNNGTVGGHEDSGGSFVPDFATGGHADFASAGAPDLAGGPDMTQADPCASGADCTQCANAMTCAMCCDVVSPNGLAKAQGFIAASCACGSANAPCNAACAASACKNMPPDQTCTRCFNMQLQTQSACVVDALMKCSMDADCDTYLSCAAGCPTM